MSAVIGIDLGTSYIKTGVFSPDGTMLGLGRERVLSEKTDGIRCELSVSAFRKAVADSMRKAIVASGKRVSEIAGISYSSQANSFLLLDGHDEPLTPFILWPDMRAVGITKTEPILSERSDFLSITGLGIYGPTACIEKVMWYRQNFPALWEKVSSIMTISDYFTFIMTGNRFGDGGTAALLGVFDTQRNNWWDAAFSTLGLSQEYFSCMLRPGTPCGNTCFFATEVFGIPEGVPFAVGGLDHQSAALGAGLGMTGDICESTGTVLCCTGMTDHFRPVPGSALVAGMPGFPLFLKLAFNDAGAILLEWYKEHYAPDMSFHELQSAAGTVAIGSNGMIAHPMVHRMPGLTGFFCGTGDSPHGQYVRAIMETIAFELKELIAKVTEKNIPQTIVSSGGGAASDVWMQIKADMMGIPFATTACEEPACFGAAMNAACAAGWAENPVEIMRTWVKTKKIFEPNMRNRNKYREWMNRYSQWKVTAQVGNGKSRTITP